MQISPARALVGLAAVSTLLTACGSASTTSSSTSSAAPASSAASSSAPVKAGSNEREVATISPRVVLSHEQGLTALDAKTGKVVAETAHPGFLRLANAGDGRHVMVADSDVFRVYDAGVESKKHGDHAHNFEYQPGLTEVTYPAKHAGHVVLHNGLTTLFSDGTGDIQVLDSAQVADPRAEVEKHKTTAPHHGVAFELTDGSLITTQGTEEARSTVQVLKDGKVVAETKDCPGVHGEAAAAPTTKGDTAVFGCENGPIVFRDGQFHKVKVADAYSRSGNLAGGHEWPVVLGDYKVDKDAEQERPTRVALIDSRTATLDLVDVGSSYWFRSLARGPHGEGLVLTYDGAIKVIDPATKKVTQTIKAIEPWQEKKEWQEPGPAIKVLGYKAYVTDADHQKLVIVDLSTGKVDKTVELAHKPVEMVVLNGKPEAPAAEGHAHAH